MMHLAPFVVTLVKARAANIAMGIGCNFRQGGPIGNGQAFLQFLISECIVALPIKRNPPLEVANGFPFQVVAPVGMGNTGLRFAKGRIIAAAFREKFRPIAIEARQQ